jgi:hypothetical protein
MLVTAGMLYSQNQTISSPFSQAKFVPNISAILDFSYIYRDLYDREIDRMYMPGYSTMGENTHYGENGFSLNYFELAIESVVDPYFDLFAVFQFTEGEFSIEEAYFKTRSLPAGFQIKGGKFFSGFGRLNARHDHQWNFCDQPLVYKSIFGAANLNDLGVQVNWVAPTDLFLKVGLEIFQGHNKDSRTFHNRDMTINDTLYEKSSVPLIAVFLKTSTDIGNFVFLGGVSHAAGRINKFLEDAGYGINGSSHVWGANLTVKYLIDSYRYLNLESEFIHRFLKGDTISETDTVNIDKKQYGFFSELVWRFKRRWRGGIRYDWLKGGDDLYPDIDLDIPGNLNKWSVMLEFNATEFSRIRLQYNYNKARVLDGELRGFSEIFMNCNLAIGAHGAHKF